MYLTKKFFQKNPPGTKIRHPLHGIATITKIEPTHIMVEWESPMNRIELAQRIEAETVPMLTRIVERQADENESEHVNTRKVNFNEAFRGNGRKL